MKTVNNLDRQYLELLQDILDNGVEKEDRTGTGTISVFGRTIRHKMSEGFPLLTTKKMAWKQIVTELMWFLRGETNIQSLVKQGNYIWVGDAYKHYLQQCDSRPELALYMPYPKDQFIEKIKTDDGFAKKWGDMGPIYGHQWRHWNIDEMYGGGYIDQIQRVIEELRETPDSRRMMVNAWNVAELDEMVLPPCHYGFQLYTRELTDQERADLYWKKKGVDTPLLPAIRSDLDKYGIPKRAVSLMWNQRSVDTPLGLPFNIASYGLLLTMIADEVGMLPDEVIGNLGDTHIYKNQIEGVKEQLTRKGDELPTIFVCKGINAQWGEDIVLNGYVPDPVISFPLSN